MMLRLETGEAYVDDLWGAQGVEPEEFRDAAADPLVADGAELLQHLHAAHGGQLNMLCELLGERTDERCTAHEPSVVPVALDRFGLRVRFCEADGRCFDACFEFPEPVRDMAGLRRAMRTLFEAAAH